MSTATAALVVGASGVTGTPLAEQLVSDARCKVYALSRRAAGLPNGVTPIACDLADPQSARSGIRACADVTHVYYCANDPDPARRLMLIGHLLDALEAGAPRFANINLLQGNKYYGCHLGPFRTPAKETDPRVPGADFYYSEEDLVMQRSRGRSWTWTGVRPHSVCGYAAGNPMNLAVVLAIYGSLLRELGRPFGFPASEACFGRLFQVIDARLLARAAIHVSTTPGCGNQAYNVGNGDIFRWQTLWPALARFFELPPAGPQPLWLPQFLAEQAPLWAQMTRKYGLRPFPYERAARWAQGDYRAPNSRFACEYDIVTDLGKIRRAGFQEALDSEEMFLRMFADLRRERVVP